MKRTADAVWQGAGLDGTGTVTTMSRALDGLPYSFKTRFQNESGQEGTNPEELIAAAHAGCFNMALAFQIAGAGATAEELRTRATVTMEKEESGNGWRLASSALVITARVPGMDRATFEQLAETAKANCPISKALGTVDITLTIDGYDG